MAFKTSYNAGLGAPQITPASIDDSAKYPVGTIIKAYDDTQGEAEFIYLPGVAAVAAGDLVAYDLLPGAQAIVRTLSGTHLNTGRAVAVAVAAVTANLFGWFQISGVAVVNATAGSAVGKAFMTTTAGSVNSTPIAGCQVLGALLSSAVGTPAAGKVYATLNRPCIQSQIT